MKITKTELRQIIKEELGKMMEGNFEEAYRDEIELDARDAGIPEEDIEMMSDDELIAAIHRAMSLR
tara:strand:- start:465 stop:662 length:198 start_codon:yes stop_codon:yes gene_type:complete